MRHIGVSEVAGKKRFNPRICKRCDIEVANVTLAFYVSIHASVKDATKKTYNRWITSEVSIHASVKDATYLSLVLSFLVWFQSTHL